jgi:hypothetical protein
MRDIIKANNLAELRDISNGNMGSLDAIHVNTIFQRAGAIAVNTRAPEQARHCLAGLVPLWSTLLPDASTSSMSSTLLTAGKLSFTDARLWSRTVAQVLTRMQQTTSFDVTNVIYALARVSLVNKGQVPGMGREEVVAAVQTLLRRLLTMVQWPRQEDGLAFLSISNCLWALARLNIQPTADQLSTLLSAALRPVLFDSAALDHYAVFVWSLAELQYRSGLYGKIKIAPEAQAVLFTPDKVCLADRLCDDHLRYMLCSLGLLVQTGAVEREGAAWAAGEVLLAELETRPNWASTDPADPLWGAAVLGLPVQQLLTRDLLRRLVAWAPSAKSVSIARLAELLVLTNHAHAGLVSAALQGAKKAMRVAPGQRTIEADRCCVCMAALGAAVARFDFNHLAPDLLQLFSSKPALRKDGVPCTPHTQQQLQATHAWLCQQQVGGGHGLTGVVHPSLLEGAAGGAGAALGASSSSGSSSGSGSDVAGNSSSSSSSRQEPIPAGQQPGGARRRKGRPADGSSPHPKGSLETAGSSSGSSDTGRKSSSGGGGSTTTSSSRPVRPAPPVLRVPFESSSSSRQLLPRPQR